jgi:type IX secretion system PorP/SprF family membrane protein
MRKALLVLTTVLILGTSAQAQNDPLYAQYLNNPLVINPAYSGLNNNFNALISYRKQWTGFGGGASTANVSVHTSLAENKMGVGILLVQDKIGISKNTEMYGTYAYKIDLNDKSLSFGLQAGFINFRNDNNDLNPYDVNDPTFSSDQNVTKINLGAGAILKGDRYFFGLSVPRMLKNRVSIDGSKSDLYKQHFYAMGAYTFVLSSRINFKPSVLVKGVKGAPFSLDGNASFTFDDKFLMGLYTRNLNAYGLIAQLKLADAYRFGYVFELPTSRSVGSAFTSHEVMLGFNLSLLRFHDRSAVTF